MALNSVLGNTHSLDELIQLQLLESFCLPVLQYAQHVPLNCHHYTNDARLQVKHSNMLSRG